MGWMLILSWPSKQLCQMCQMGHYNAPVVQSFASQLLAWLLTEAPSMDGFLPSSASAPPPFARCACVTTGTLQ
eukprot:11614776-Prorocentrum_lima.AAC.1